MIKKYGEIFEMESMRPYLLQKHEMRIQCHCNRVYIQNTINKWSRRHVKQLGLAVRSVRVTWKSGESV